MQFDPLLPDMEGLRFGQIQIQPGRVTMEVLSAAASAACPICGRANRRIHSHYIRQLKDLPWQGTPVALRVRVRRFFCDNPSCRRGIFAERLGRVARVYGRTTDRLADALVAIGLSCGGESGSRLAGRLGMSASPDYILDAIRRQPGVRIDTPKVLGVDDWAFRRGARYGTILCDLENHQPVDLLPDRTSESLAAWLKEHPGVEVISRDRADAYAQGASAGAPQAAQVTDRWHLLHNLHDALARIAARCHQQVAAAAKAAARRAELLPRPASLSQSRPTDSDQVTRPASCAELARQAHRARRLATYEQVVEIHRQGQSQRSIAQQLDLGRDLVRRFISAGSFPERAQPVRPSRADTHTEYLRRRWAQGCRNASTLTQELKSQGACLSYFSIRRLVAHWRDQPPSRDGEAIAALALGSGPAAVPSSNRVAWLLQRSETGLECDEHELVRRLRGLCPDLRDGADLAKEFASLIHEHRAGDLDTWIALASQPPAPPELATFAKGLTKDYAAVKAAAVSPWSNGQVEGQVNRLKLIKRQMYGRANFDLLRRRVLSTG